mgnify:FL=1
MKHCLRFVRYWGYWKFRLRSDICEFTISAYSIDNNGFFHAVSVV